MIGSGVATARDRSSAVSDTPVASPMFGYCGSAQCPEGTDPFRMAIVARTRWVEDLLVSEGLGQCVLLGAGLDTFAQRHGDLAELRSIHLYERRPLR